MTKASLPVLQASVPISSVPIIHLRSSHSISVSDSWASAETFVVPNEAQGADDQHCVQKLKMDGEDSTTSPQAASAFLLVVTGVSKP